MDDLNSLPPEEPGQRIGAGAPVSMGRRRFAKGAAPVVLGSLLSKPVLGAEYICTVSGHASGNASVPATADLVCDVGKTPDDWALEPNWPSGFTKGVLPAETGSTCTFTEGATLFNGYAGLANTFYFSTTSCEVGTTEGTGYEAASMLQVLSAPNTSELFQLGRAVVASLLNAAEENSNYPVSQARIVEMFNAVKNGGNYFVKGVNLDLTPIGVIRYLEKLYS